MELFYSPTVFGHKDSQFHPIFQESRTFFVSYCRKQADFAKFTNSQIHKVHKFTKSKSSQIHKVKKFTKSKSHKNCSYFVASTHSELKMRHPTIGSTTFGQRVLADAWQSIFVGRKCSSARSEMPVFPVRYEFSTSANTIIGQRMLAPPAKTSHSSLTYLLRNRKPRVRHASSHPPLFHRHHAMRIDACTSE